MELEEGTGHVSSHRMHYAPVVSYRAPRRSRSSMGHATPPEVMVMVRTFVQQLSIHTSTKGDGEPDDFHSHVDRGS